jgi:hypothetical protein
MKSMEEALERNFMNGEAAGIQMGITMLPYLIEAWEAEIRRAKAETDQPEKEN